MKILARFFKKNLSPLLIITGWKTRHAQGVDSAVWYAITVLVRALLLYRFVWVCTDFFKFQIFAALQPGEQYFGVLGVAGFLLALTAVPAVIICTRSSWALVAFAAAGLALMVLTDGVFAMAEWVDILLLLLGLWFFSHDRIANAVRPTRTISHVSRQRARKVDDEVPVGKMFNNVTQSYDEHWTPANPSAGNPFRIP